MRTLLDLSDQRAGRMMGYAIDREGFWEIVCVDPPTITDLPKVEFLRTCGDDISQYYSIDDSMTFEEQYLPKLIKSNLGQSEETANADGHTDNPAV